MNDQLTIRITGKAGSGKTLLAKRIAAILFNAGHVVTLRDEGGLCNWHHEDAQKEFARRRVVKIETSSRVRS